MQRVNIRRGVMTVVVITAVSYPLFSQIDVLEKVVLIAAEHEELDERGSCSMLFSSAMARFA